MNKKEFNFTKIQEFYDNNHSWHDVINEFRISQNTINKYIKIGNLKSRLWQETCKMKPGFKKNHTEETKLRMSEIRKEYLLNHPDKKIWQTKEYGKSIPCEKVKKLLQDNGIEFIPEYEPLLHKKRFFSVDIAFPHIKVGIEINGRQHYNTEGNLLPYYKNRHELIESEGWKLYEIPYNVAFNTDLILKTINDILTSPTKIDFDYKLYKPREKKKRHISIYPNNVKYNYPSDDELRQMAKTLRLKELCSKLNIPMKPLWYHLYRKNIKAFKPPIKIKIKKPFGRHTPRPNTRKAIRPEKQELENLIHQMPFTQIAKLYKVSDNAIRRWCVYAKIEIPKFEIGHWLKPEFKPKL